MFIIYVQVKNSILLYTWCELSSLHVEEEESYKAIRYYCFNGGHVLLGGIMSFPYAILLFLCIF